MGMTFGSISRAVTAAVLLARGGCHTLRAKSCHKAQSSMGAKTLAALQIPPGLDTPDTTNALLIPRLNEPAPPPRTGRDPCLDEPPSYDTPKPQARPQA